MDNWGPPLYGDPCRECGFTWANGVASMTSMLSSLPESIDDLVAGATGTERLPELGWNVSAYIAHMTDNTRIWAERMIAVARGADAHVVLYDPDLLAEARRYNEVALSGARWSLRVAIEGWLPAAEESEAAGVVMLHSERGATEFSDVVAANAHDSYHDRWDLRRILR
jgi:hypothetical protein